MKRNYILPFILFWFQTFFCQSQFEFNGKNNKLKIPFTVFNNLVIIPIEVNGITLNFLLDTGVEETILFSLDESNEIKFSQIEKIKMKGFGSKEAFDGYKSFKNKMKIKNFEDLNHTIYLVLDQEFNISSQVGVPINGIIGYQFFKNHLIKIDYESKKLTIYKNKEKQLKKISKKFSKIPLYFHDGKPYIMGTSVFEIKKNELETKLLIDTGNSDALWLFKSTNENIKIPQQIFDDYLGKGFSGDVFGVRGRIKEFKLQKFTFPNPLVAFPDTTSSKDIDNLFERNGSIGGELMKRFTVFFDYQNNAMFLKKNSYFDDPFHYNMSGIEVQHQGLQWVQESYYENGNKPSNMMFDRNGEPIGNKLKYKFELKPVYVILNVRKNSQADLAGLKKDDIIVKINKRNGYSYTLQQINDLLKSEDGKNIEFEVDRNGVLIKIKFQLKIVI